MRAEYDNREELLRFGEHLVQYGEMNSVSLTSDLYRLDGVVLAHKGAAFDRDLLVKLTEIDNPPNYIQSLQLMGALDAAQVLKDMEQLVITDKALSAFDGLYGDWSFVKEYIARIADLHAFVHCLTLLKALLPQVYEQALFVAWLGSILMRKMKRAANDAFNIFFLGLAHDVGLLFLPIAPPEHVLLASERQRQQKHTMLGASLLKHITPLTDDLIEAVTEHHENLDGTGYPAGKVGSMISRFGQCLGFLDAVHAIYRKRLSADERAFNDLIAMIRMNGHSRFGILGKRLIEWLQVLPEPDGRAVPNDLMPAFIQSVREKNDFIGACVDVISDIASGVGYRHGDNRVFALQNAIIHINIAITQSGIINEAYIRWLDQVESASLEHAYREVEDVFLMMQEVIYHIYQLKHQMAFYLTESVDEAVGNHIQSGLDRLADITLPEMPSSLEHLWIAKVR